MNILPLILSFLIIFSCLMTPFLKRARTFVITETSFEAFSATHQHLINGTEKRAFEKQTKEKPVRGKKNKGRKGSPRFFNPRPEKGKFNLELLLTTPNPKESPFYPVAVNLLNQLYGHLPSFEAEPLLKEMLGTLTTLKNDPSCEQAPCLNDLFPKNSKLKKTYYQLLRGTNTFIPNQQGIPPLGEFMTCVRTDSKPLLNFVFASPELLAALFNKAIAEKIIELEKVEDEDGRILCASLSKQQLKELLSGKANTALARFESSLDFSKKIPRKEAIVRKDKRTSLIMKKKLNPPTPAAGG